MEREGVAPTCRLQAGQGTRVECVTALPNSSNSIRRTRPTLSTGFNWQPAGAFVLVCSSAVNGANGRVGVGVGAATVKVLEVLESVLMVLL